MSRTPCSPAATAAAQATLPAFVISLLPQDLSDLERRAQSAELLLLLLLSPAHALHVCISLAVAGPV
jgi:hypothetical protein